MKYFRFVLLRFNHAVEIGARLAYMGHFRRTKESYLETIVKDELNHQYQCLKILTYYGKSPSLFFDIPFTMIGLTVGFLCRFAPRPILNLVARSLEFFAVYSYQTLSNAFPEDRTIRLSFQEMAMKEKEHEQYFIRSYYLYDSKVVYQLGRLVRLKAKEQSK